MKLAFLFLAFTSFTSAYASQTFSGSASYIGSPVKDCWDTKENAIADAEASATHKAELVCSRQSLHATQVTEFQAKESCKLESRLVVVWNTHFDVTTQAEFDCR